MEDFRKISVEGEVYNFCLTCICFVEEFFKAFLLSDKNPYTGKRGFVKEKEEFIEKFRLWYTEKNDI